MTSAPDGLPDDLAEALERVRDRLAPLGSRVLFYRSIGSTNDAAALLAERTDTDGSIVIADEQTAGRGRRGRVWYSPPGSGLYVSVVLAPGPGRGDRARAVSLLTLAAGVAIAEGIQAATGLAPDIKWPNDVQIGGRKVCGILAEAVAPLAAAPVHPAARVVLGYGINVSRAAYPPDIAARATALDVELGRPADRAAICAETLAAIAGRYRDLLAGRFDAILDAWRSRAPGSTGARVTWTTATGRHEGTTAGIAADGALLVRVDGDIERLVAGEISELR